MNNLDPQFSQFVLPNGCISSEPTREVQKIINYRVGRKKAAASDANLKKKNILRRFERETNFKQRMRLTEIMEGVREVVEMDDGVVTKAYTGFLPERRIELREELSPFEQRTLDDLVRVESELNFALNYTLEGPTSMFHEVDEVDISKLVGRLSDLSKYKLSDRRENALKVTNAKTKNLFGNHTLITSYTLQEVNGIFCVDVKYMDMMKVGDVCEKIDVVYRVCEKGPMELHHIEQNLPISTTVSSFVDEVLNSPNTLVGTDDRGAHIFDIGNYSAPCMISSILKNRGFEVKTDLQTGEIFGGIFSDVKPVSIRRDDMSHIHNIQHLLEKPWILGGDPLRRIVKYVKSNIGMVKENFHQKMNEINRV